MNYRWRGRTNKTKKQHALRRWLYAGSAGLMIAVLLMTAAGFGPFQSGVKWIGSILPGHQAGIAPLSSDNLANPQVIKDGESFLKRLNPFDNDSKKAPSLQ